MTVGKDVSALFPDVVNCMQTDNLELKKLVYLYLMNYAKSQPDMAIMAVNTFVKVRKMLHFFFFLLYIFPITFHLLRILFNKVFMKHVVLNLYMISLPFFRSLFPFCSQF